MNDSSINNNVITVEHLSTEQHPCVDNQQHQNSTQNQSSSSATDSFIKLAKKPMTPTPLEYSCWSRHRTATAVGTFALFTCLSIFVGVLTVYFTSSKLDKTCVPVFKRINKSSLVSSSRPRSVAVGDLNNDHQTDIVVANSLTSTIGVFISKGDGTFTEQQTYPTGIESHPYSVDISDFNNDDYLDIAVANYDNNNIGIFLNNGNGTFIDYNLFSVGSSRPLFITTSDLNKDGQMDIVVANDGTNSIGILFGYGNGSFQDQVTYDTGYDSFPYSLAVADFNNDSVLDIVVANYGTNTIGIFYGYGNGTFRSQQTYTTTHNSNPSSIAVGDFNDDTKVDIVVANYGIGNIGIFYNHGNESFLPQRTYPITNDSYPQYITVSDVNKDDKLDIAIIDSRNNQVHVLLGNGNGNFPMITTYDTISESNPLWIALGDFNNNNQSDIVVVNYGTNNILVLLDYSIKPSARRKILYGRITAHVSSVAISDFNNDHISDIVANVNNEILILTGLGNGTFGEATTYSTGYNSSPHYVCVGDMNNDNRMDIVVADTLSNSADVLLGYGDGTFGDVTTYSTGIGSQPWSVALGDFNHDNALDIVSANYGTNSIGILLGNGNGTFDTMVNYSTGYRSEPYTVAVGVINNDNHLDIAVPIDYRIIIFLGKGDGTFIKSDTNSSTGSRYSISIVLADLNSDTHLDIVVANTYTNNVGVFLGYGNGSFATQTIYFTGSPSSPYDVIVADFNNDNITDIAATAHGISQIVIFYGSGNGSFELTRTYSTGLDSKPYGISAADLNDDKHLEIVIALWGNGDIALLTEYYAAEFVNQTEYSTGWAPQPFSVDVGDFNNDNQSDIVVAYFGTDNLDILLGSYNGTFHTEMIYLGTHYQPQYVITCDVNRDSYLDIISVNSKNDSISIIMGYGNGSFAEELIYSTGDGSHPYGVTCSDLNNDTHLDLVIANEGTDNIGIFFGFNYTSFQSQVPYSSNYDYEQQGVIVNDFNNDAFLDIATVFNSNNSLGILLGYGNGSFSNIMIYSTGIGSGPQGIDAGDFNNDSLLDIVVCNSDTNNVGVLLGYGNGSFASIMTYSTGNQSDPIAVAVGDFNNDGQLDIVVANYYGNSVGVLLGYGNGSFSIVQTYSTGRHSKSNSVTVGDFDNDGRLDIAVANYDINNVGVLLGYGNGTFKNQITLFTSSRVSYPYWVTVGDFNTDNQLDIAVANRNDNSIGIFLGYGNGSFSNGMSYSMESSSSPECIRVDDFNNDNILDIAVVNSGSNSIVVLFGFGDGTFLLGKSYSTGTASKPSALASGDFNKDGRSDVVVANYAGNNIRVFLGYDSQPFGNMSTTGAGSQPHSVTTGDLNSDGHLDIVVANYGSDNVGILLGRNNRVFDPMMIYSTGKGSAPYAVGVADFNNDTYLDIVVSNSGTDNIDILLGYGNGTFADRMIYSTGTRSRPYGIAISDFNNDGVLDIVVANSGTSNIYLLYGYGNGTFGNHTSYSLGYGYEPYSIAVRDLNGDGWMDMVIACYGTDHVEILMKMC